MVLSADDILDETAVASMSVQVFVFIICVNPDFLFTFFPSFL